MSLQALTMVLDFAPHTWNSSKRIVAMAVADRVNNENFTWCSYSDIERRTGLSRRQCVRIMNELVAEGIIARQRRDRDNGSQASNMWIWLWELKLGGVKPVTPPVTLVSPPS